MAEYNKTVYQNGVGADVDAVNLNKNEDATKVAYDHAQIVAGNPHGTSAADVGAAATTHTHDDRYYTETESDAAYYRVRSATAPASPQTGWEWYDTTSSPAILKQWTGSAWEVPQASGGGGSGTSNHSLLTNLGADDHLQYALTTGTRLRMVRSGTSPATPSAGQQWLDTTTYSNGLLKNYDGTSYVETLAQPPDGSITLAKAATAISLPYICTSGTRPTSPKTGQLIYQTDNDKLLVNYGTSGAPLWRRAGGAREIPFGKNGALTTNFFGIPWQAPFALSIVYVLMNVRVPSTSGSVIGDIQVAASGAPDTYTSLYATNTGSRPTLAATTGYGVSAALPATLTMAAGDFLLPYIQSTGTGASDLAMQVGYVETA